MYEGLNTLSINAFQDRKLPLSSVVSEFASCFLFSCQTSGGSSEIFEEPSFSSLRGRGNP